VIEGVEVLKDLLTKTSEKDVERLYNCYWSQKEPFCALCTSLCTRKVKAASSPLYFIYSTYYFLQSKQHEPLPDNWKEYKYSDDLPQASEVWSPAYVFSRRVKVHTKLI